MCGQTPVERHHRLTRARGGQLLDKYTDYHLMDLCKKHHAMADGRDARAGGLVLDGYVTTCSVCAVPEYMGPDEHLAKYYGKAVHEQAHGVEETAGDPEHIPLRSVPEVREAPVHDQASGQGLHQEDD